MRKIIYTAVIVSILSITVNGGGSERKMPQLQQLTRTIHITDSTADIFEMVTSDSARIITPQIRSVIKGGDVEIEIVPVCVVDSILIMVRHSGNQTDTVGVSRRAPYKIKWNASDYPDQDQLHLQFGYILFKTSGQKIICPPMPHRWVLDRDNNFSRKIHSCHQTTTPERIKIDGDLSDWRGVRSARIGTEGTFKIRWSNSHIFFAAHVFDTSVTYSDFLEVHFDLHNDKSQFAGINHRSIRFGPRTRSNSFTVDLTSDGFILSDSINVLLSREMKWARTIDNGYTIEASIPLFCLSDLQFPNMRFGFDVSIFNTDAANQSRFTSWSGTIYTNRYNPSQWGTIKLHQALPILKIVLSLLLLIAGAAIAFVIAVLIKQNRDDYIFDEIESKGSSELMRSITEKLQKLLSNPDLDKELLSKELGIDSEQLESEMLKETGGSFGMFLEFERIRTARSLLRETDLSVEDIFSRTGFTELKSLSDAFEKICGTTMEKYRNRVREESSLEEED